MQREVPSGGVATATRGPQWGRGAWEGKGEMDEHTALFWEGAFHLRVPHTPSSPSGRRQGHGSGARRPFKKKPSALSLSLSPRVAAQGVPLVDFKFQVPAVTASGGRGGGAEKGGRGGRGPSRSPSLWTPRRPWWSLS